MTAPTAAPRDVRAALAVTWLLAALPVWLVGVVPVTDYPAHLVRVTLLSNLPLDPVLGRFWTVDFAVVPNLAMDLFVPAVAWAIGATAGLKLFLTLSLGLWILGAALIRDALWGRLDVPALAAAAFAVNASFGSGFFNFHFGIGIALCAAGLWLARPERSPRFLAAMAVIAAVLLLCHLMALAVAVLVIGGIEIGRATTERGGLRSLALAARDAVLVLLPGAVLWVLVMEHGGDGGLTFAWSRNVLALLIYSSRLGGIDYNALPFLLLVAAIGLGWWTRRITVAPVMLPVLVLLLLATLLSPSEAFGGTVIHIRMAAVFAIVLLASLRFDLTSRQARAGAIALVGLTALGCASQVALWRPKSQAIAEFRETTGRLPEGVRLAGALVDPRRDGAYAHATDMAILDRKAFVPDFFTTRGQSTLRLTHEMAPIGASNAIDGAIPAFSELAGLLPAGGADRLDPAARNRLRPYLTLGCDFDAIVAWGPRDETASPAGLEIVATGAAFTLYRIVPRADATCVRR